MDECPQKWCLRWLQPASTPKTAEKSEFISLDYDAQGQKTAMSWVLQPV